ncbi:MAG: LuxR C-terminal-related transcriptional regulator [Lachnospiraceae bacterium]|nr:LuxR C-terminal-related transcriptional regulator [Lachnospiraceae bacterium]
MRRGEVRDRSGRYSRGWADMRKHMLRILLGTVYVCLLMTLLLYQAGLFGERREWAVAVLGTLFLGVALAVVLALYLRVNDQIKKQMREQSKTAAQKSRRQDSSLSGGSYEETYDRFLAVMENRALSERELEVAWLLYRGYTNRQIGESLFIAETTVKKHVSHIYQKMDVCSRKEFRGTVQSGALSGSCAGG